MRRLTWLVAILVQLLAAGTVTAVAAPGGSQPAALVIRSFSDNGTSLAMPVAGDPFTVEIDAVAADGSPAEFPRRTRVTLAVVKQPHTTGVLTGNTVGEFAAHSSHATISGAIYSKFENGVVLKVTAGDVQGTKPVDVAATADVETATPNTPITLQDPDCLEATPELPTCSILQLPKGASGTAQLFETSCKEAFGSPKCLGLTTAPTPSLIANAIADTSLYTRTEPATVIMMCDKTLCLGSGVTSYSLWVDIKDTGVYTQAPACPAKGVIAPLPGTFCVDYAQSHRTRTSDLVLYLLFADDIRMTF
jgi:hypothetical protein